MASNAGNSVGGNKSSLERWREATAQGLASGAGALGKNLKEIGSESVKGAKATYRASQTHGFFGAFFGALREGLSPIGKILKFIAFFLGFSLAVLMLTYAGAYAWNSNSHGTLDSGLKKTGVAIENAEIPGVIKNFLSGLIRSAETGGLETLDTSISDSKKAETDRLVKIESVENDKGFYRSEEPIGIIVNAFSHNLARPSRATLNCTLEDYNGPVNIINNRLDGGDYVDLPPDEDFPFSLKCDFLKGIKAGYFGSYGIKSVVGKARIIYLADAETYWEPYFVVEKYEKESNNKMENLQDPDIVKGLTSGKITTRNLPLYNSAINLKFAHFESMPFNEKISYRIKVVFSDSDPFSGNLGKINSGSLIVPDFVEPNADVRRCDFVVDDKQQEAGKRVYKLTDTFLQKANQDCYAGDLKFLGYDECIENFKRKIEAICDFKFNLNEEEFNSIQKRGFLVKADYEYEVSRKFIVDVYPEPRSTIVCKDLNQVECEKNTECRWMEGMCQYAGQPTRVD